jgi:hypothetical protein
MIVRGMLAHRRTITWVRPSLSGYQASACFYCGAPLTPLIGLDHSADVDHFFPHMLMSRGVWARRANRRRREADARHNILGIAAASGYNGRPSSSSAGLPAISSYI